MNGICGDDFKRRDATHFHFDVPVRGINPTVTVKSSLRDSISLRHSHPWDESHGYRRASLRDSVGRRCCAAGWTRGQQHVPTDFADARQRVPTKMEMKNPAPANRGGGEIFNLTARTE